MRSGGTDYADLADELDEDSPMDALVPDIEALLAQPISVVADGVGAGAREAREAEEQSDAAWRRLRHEDQLIDFEDVSRSPIDTFMRPLTICSPYIIPSDLLSAYLSIQTSIDSNLSIQTSIDCSICLSKHPFVLVSVYPNIHWL